MAIALASIDLSTRCLVDFAGVDGFQVARSLVGDPVCRIAPFHSLSFMLEGRDAALLRLCENNFRLRCDGDTETVLALVRSHAGNAQVWVKSLSWMGAIAFPDNLLPELESQFVPKPPHRLQGLPLHRAAVGRINGQSVLVWRHPIGAIPAVELQMAANQIGAIAPLFSAKPTFTDAG